MFTRIARAQTEITPLPGRDWHTYIGPQNAPTERVSIGISIFEPGARPVGHVHDSQEETVYCVSGRGRLVSETGTAELEAGRRRPHPARHVPCHRMRRAGGAGAPVHLHAAGRTGLLRERQAGLT